MPINPNNYPPNWKQISLAVRQTAGNRCEICGVLNHSIGARDRHGKWHDSDEIESMSAQAGDSLWDEYPQYIRIVLTVAHMDHDTSNNELPNLKALCQLHHLRHDAEQHAANAKVTRANNKEQKIRANGQIGLFDDYQS